MPILRSQTFSPLLFQKSIILFFTEVHDPFWLNMCSCCNLRNEVHFYPNRYPVVSTPFPHWITLLKINWTCIFFFPVNFWCFICFYFRIAINIIIMIIVSINSWVFQIKKCFKLFASYIIFLIPDYALLTDFLLIMRCIPLLLDMSIKLWLYTRCCECYMVEWLDFVNVLKEHLFGAGRGGWK